MTTRAYYPEEKPLTGWHFCMMGAAAGLLFALIFLFGVMFC